MTDFTWGDVARAEGTERGLPTPLDCYRMVAEELDVPAPQRAEALASLDEMIVERAENYARRAHKRWPPKPAESGWRVTVESW